MLLFNHLPRLESLDTEFIDFVIFDLVLKEICAMTSAMLVTCYHVYFDLIALLTDLCVAQRAVRNSQGSRRRQPHRFIQAGLIVNQPMSVLHR